MEKINVKRQAEIRGDLYETTLAALESAGFETETTNEGALIHLKDGEGYAVLKITIKDGSKFDIDAARTEYAEKVQKAAELAAVRAQKAEEKALKAAEKAATKESAEEVTE